jgi:Adaptin N terminal region
MRFLCQSNPRSVCDHREIVLSCLTDDDITIRTRALELLAGIVSRKSLVDLVHHLLQVLKSFLFYVYYVSTVMRVDLTDISSV